MLGPDAVEDAPPESERIIVTTPTGRLIAGLALSHTSLPLLSRSGGRDPFRRARRRCDRRFPRRGCERRRRFDDGTTSRSPTRRRVAPALGGSRARTRRRSGAGGFRPSRWSSRCSGARSAGVACRSTSPAARRSARRGRSPAPRCPDAASRRKPATGRRAARSPLAGRPDPAPATAEASSTEDAASLSQPVVGPNRQVRRRHERAADPRDLMGAVGEGAEHSPGRGPRGRRLMTSRRSTSTLPVAVVGGSPDRDGGEADAALAESSRSAAALAELA